jgi:hypothetical protein
MENGKQTMRKKGNCKTYECIGATVSVAEYAFPLLKIYIPKDRKSSSLSLSPAGAAAGAALLLA